MKAAVIAAMVAALFFPAGACAGIQYHNYDVNVTILPGMDAEHEISTSFSVSGEPVNSLDFFTSGNVRDAVAYRDYELPVNVEKDGSTLLTVYFGELLAAGDYKTSLRFITDGLVMSHGESHSVLFSFTAPAEIGNFSLRVTLPKGMVLEGGENACYPGAEVSTDGERIIVSWSDGTIGKGEKWLFRAAFAPAAGHDYTPLFIALPAAAALAAISLIALRFRGRARTAFMEGLGQSEKALTELLIKEGPVKQNAAQKRLGFSKARMSRAVSSLVSKGLLKKEKRGKTNRLVLLK